MKRAAGSFARHLGWLALALALAAAAACNSHRAVGGAGGAGGGVADCGEVQPCGGEIVGSWTIKGACAPAPTLAGVVAQLEALCGDVVTTTTIDVSGTVVLNADGTYTTSGTDGANATVHVTASCLAQSGMTCDDVGRGVGTASACVSASGACDCTLSTPAQSATQTGTYTVSGTSLTLDVMTPAPRTEIDGFCVTGDELHVMNVDTSMTGGPMGMATIVSDLVLTKR
jgi:hypothetical protein